MYPCPCCGYLVFEELHNYEICPNCYWEDDMVQLAFPDLPGGANNCSLIEGQRNYELSGVCEDRFKASVRQPSILDIKDPDWRPLKTEIDPHWKWGSQEDGQLWDAVKNRKSLCLYYWSPEYWLLHHPR